MNSLFTMTNNDSLDDLRVFAAVAELGGFSAAARRLGVSKAMTSVTVSRLEARLGVRLFQRTTRRLSLTEAGASALPHVQRALLAAQDAQEAATRLRISPRGTLRVSAPMSFGILQLVPAVGAFTADHPEVTVDLALDDRVVDLVEGGFDVAVRVGTLADSSLVAQRIGRSRNALVAHPDYRARRGLPRIPSELAGHEVLFYSLSASGNAWVLERAGKRERVLVRGPVRANSSLALRDAVFQGLGIASLPLFVIGEELASGRLLPVLPEWRLPEQGIYAVTTAREHMPAKTRAFIDFLKARIGEGSRWEPSRRRR